MHGHQRGGAGGVDRHRRALQAEGVGDAAGDDAGCHAGGNPSVRHRIVLVHHPREDARLAAAQRRRVDAGVLQRLPGGFQQQPLLGVHHLGLARADAEEAGVELRGAFDEAALP